MKICEKTRDKKELLPNHDFSRDEIYEKHMTKWHDDRTMIFRFDEGKARPENSIPVLKKKHEHIDKVSWQTPESLKAPRNKAPIVIFCDNDKESLNTLVIKLLPKLIGLELERWFATRDQKRTCTWSLPRQ